MTLFKTIIFFIFLNNIQSGVSFLIGNKPTSTSPLLPITPSSTSTSLSLSSQFSNTNTNANTSLRIHNTGGSSTLSYKNHDEGDEAGDTRTDTDIDTGIDTQTEQQIKEIKKVIKKKTRVVNSTPIQNLVPIDTLEEYNLAMSQHETDIVVIRFYSTWCKSCASVAPSYRRLARRNPKATFLDVAVSSKNTDLHEGLNIPYVPYGHIYHSNQIVEEMKISKIDWNIFERKVKNMMQGYCALDDIEIRKEHLPF